MMLASMAEREHLRTLKRAKVQLFFDFAGSLHKKLSKKSP